MRGRRTGNVCLLSLGLIDFTPVWIIVAIAFAIGGVLHDDPSGIDILALQKTDQRRQRS